MCLEYFRHQKIDFFHNLLKTIDNERVDLKGLNFILLVCQPATFLKSLDPSRKRKNDPFRMILISSFQFSL